MRYYSHECSYHGLQGSSYNHEVMFSESCCHEVSPASLMHANRVTREAKHIKVDRAELIKDYEFEDEEVLDSDSDDFFADLELNDG